MTSFAACCRAMIYVGLRAQVRSLRGVGTRPWALVGLACAMVIVAACQFWLADALPHGGKVADSVIQFAPLVLPLMLATTSRRSPLRLSAAEASWLLTAPGGGRAVFARHLLARPAKLGLIALVSGLAVRWWLGLPPWSAVMQAVAVTVLASALGLLAGGRHLLAVRVPGVLPALRVAAVLWGIAILSLPAVNVPASAWVRLEPITRPLVAAVLRPDAVPDWSLPALLAALAAVGALMVVAAKGFHEEADKAVRESVQASEVMRHSRSGQELNTARYRSGVRSLRHRPVFAGERALWYRALAQERRAFADHLVLPVAALILMIVLMVWAPGYAWIPLSVVVWNLVGVSAVEGLAIEHDHHFTRLAGLRPLPSLLWVNAVTVARSTLILEVFWLPWAPLLGLRTWAAGAILIPAGSALMAAAGDFATAATSSMLARHIIALAATAAGAVPCAVLITTGASLILAVASLVLAVTALLAVTARLGFATPRDAKDSFRRLPA